MSMFDRKYRFLTKFYVESFLTNKETSKESITDVLFQSIQDQNDLTFKQIVILRLQEFYKKTNSFEIYDLTSKTITQNTNIGVIARLNDSRIGDIDRKSSEIQKEKEQKNPNTTKVMAISDIIQRFLEYLDDACLINCRYCNKKLMKLTSTCGFKTFESYSIFKRKHIKNLYEYRKCEIVKLHEWPQEYNQLFKEIEQFDCIKCITCATDKFCENNEFATVIGNTISNGRVNNNLKHIEIDNSNFYNKENQCSKQILNKCIKFARQFSMLKSVSLKSILIFNITPLVMQCNMLTICQCILDKSFFQGINKWSGSNEKLYSIELIDCIINTNHSDMIKNIIQNERFGAEFLKLSQISIKKDKKQKYYPKGFFAVDGIIPSLLMGINNCNTTKNNLNNDDSIDDDDSKATPFQPLSLECLKIVVNSPDWKQPMNIDARNFINLKSMQLDMANKCVKRTHVIAIVNNIKSLLFNYNSTFTKLSTQLKWFKIVNGNNLLYSDIFNENFFGQKTTARHLKNFECKYTSSIPMKSIQELTATLSNFVTFFSNSESNNNGIKMNMNKPKFILTLEDKGLSFVDYSDGKYSVGALLLKINVLLNIKVDLMILYQCQDDITD